MSQSGSPVAIYDAGYSYTIKDSKDADIHSITVCCTAQKGQHTDSEVLESILKYMNRHSRIAHDGQMLDNGSYMVCTSARLDDAEDRLTDRLIRSLMAAAKQAVILCNLNLKGKN